MTVRPIRTVALLTAAAAFCSVLSASATAPAAATEPQLQTFSTGQPRFGGALGQGWWSPGLDNHADNTNYLVGRYEGREYRNFFTFDLSELRGLATDAWLEVLETPDHPDKRVRLRLFDVTTPAHRLNNNDGRNGDIFRDLGTGTLYGDQDVVSGQSRLDLNRDAVYVINNSRRFFSIGGRVVFPEGQSPDRRFLFGDSHQAGPVRLVVKTVPWPNNVRPVVR